MTAARRNIYIDDDINDQIEILVAGSGGRHGELRYVFNSLLRDSPKMKKLLKSADVQNHTSTKVSTTVIANGTVSPDSGLIVGIFDYWCQVMGRGAGTKLTPKRLKNIKARLADGYKVEEIKQAIDGCNVSDFHMEGGHNDIELICRSGEKLEGFIGKSLNNGSNPNERSGQVQGQAQGSSQRGGNGQQQTPLQRTIADHDAGMAYARTLRENTEAQSIDGQEIRGALE